MYSVDVPCTFSIIHHILYVLCLHFLKILVSRLGPRGSGRQGLGARGVHRLPPVLAALPLLPLLDDLRGGVPLGAPAGLACCSARHILCLLDVANFWRAGSRLYRSRFLRLSTHFAAFSSSTRYRFFEKNLRTCAPLQTNVFAKIANLLTKFQAKLVNICQM